MTIQSLDWPPCVLFSRTGILLIGLVAALLALNPTGASAEDRCPKIGSMAPDIGLYPWLQIEGNNEPKIAKLRGRVVLVHCFGHGCPPCMRKGIPLVVDAVKANADRGLTAISITAYVEELRDFVGEYGMKHSIMLMSALEDKCPYIDTGRNGVTYVFIIDRQGRVLWRGNHAAKEKDFLKELQKALNQTPLPSLGRDLSPKLNSAQSKYYEGEFAEARKSAMKIRDKYAKRSGSAFAAITEDAARVIEAVDKTAADLVERMKSALEKGDALAFAEAADLMAKGFDKTDEGKKASSIEEEAQKNRDFANELKAARAWLALEQERPPLFPALKDKSYKSFAKKLKRYLKDSGQKVSSLKATELLKRVQSG